MEENKLIKIVIDLLTVTKDLLEKLPKEQEKEGVIEAISINNFEAWKRKYISDTELMERIRYVPRKYF